MICAGCCHENVTQLAQLRQYMNKEHKLVMTLNEDESKECASQHQIGGKPKSEVCW